MPEIARRQRCTAILPETGRRCRKWALRPDAGSPNPDPQLCAIHALDRAAGSRCSARRRDGGQCRQLAARGSQPPLCRIHSTGTRAKAGDRRRCRARTKAGTRCRNWATLASQKDGNGLCDVHQDGYRLPVEEEEGRCSALTKRGKRCRSWAVRDSDPPLCPIHRGPSHNRPAQAADYEAGRVCSATTVKGRRCKKWAMAHTDPPLCWAHAYPELNPNMRHGYLRRTPFLPPAASAHILHLAAEGRPLTAEIALLRLKIRSLLAYLGRPGLSSGEWLAAHRLLLQALRLVARLLRTQAALGGEEQRAHGESTAATGAGLRPKSGGWLGPVLEEMARQEAADKEAPDERKP